MVNPNGGTVTYVFQVIDRASRQAQTIVNNIVNTTAQGQGRLRDEKGRFVTNPKGFMYDVLFGNIGAAGVLGALSMVQGQIGNMMSALGEAANFQTQTLATATDVARNLGVPIDKAKELTAQLQKEMGIVAAELPGENQDYIGVLNALSATFAKQFTGDVEGYRTALQDVTKRVGALGAMHRISGYESGSTINRLIAGTAGFGELAQNDILQKNPEFVAQMREAAKAEGVAIDKWMQTTTEKRLKIVQTALKRAATDELFAQFEDTADSLQQGLKSMFFDMQTGAFGMLRQVGTREDRSVLDAYTSVLKRVTTLISALNRLGKGLGVAIDPLTFIIDMFDGIANLLGNITYAIDVSAPGEAIAAIGGAIAETFNQWLDSIIGMARDLDTSVLARIIEFAHELTAAIDWGKVGELCGIVITKAVLMLVRGAWQLITGGAGVGGDQIVGFAVGLVRGVLVALYDATLKPIIQSLTQFAKRVKSKWDEMTSLISQMVKPIMDFLTKASGVFSNPMGAVGAAVNPVGAIASTVGGLLSNPVGTVIDKLTGKDKKDTKPLSSPNGKPLTPTPAMTQSTNTTQSNTVANTIQNLTIAATTPQDAQGVASMVIEELERRLGFSMATQIG